jgi:hypothetical protein
LHFSHFVKNISKILWDSWQFFEKKCPQYTVTINITVYVNVDIVLIPGNVYLHIILFLLTLYRAASLQNIFHLHKQDCCVVCTFLRGTENMSLWFMVWVYVYLHIIFFLLTLYRAASLQNIFLLYTKRFFCVYVPLYTLSNWRACFQNNEK